MMRCCALPLLLHTALIVWVGRFCTHQQKADAMAVQDFAANVTWSSSFSAANVTLLGSSINSFVVDVVSPNHGQIDTSEVLFLRAFFEEPLFVDEGAPAWTANSTHLNGAIEVLCCGTHLVRVSGNKHNIPGVGQFGVFDSVSNYAMSLVVNSLELQKHNELRVALLASHSVHYEQSVVANGGTTMSGASQRASVSNSLPAFGRATVPGRRKLQECSSCSVTVNANGSSKLTNARGQPLKGSFAIGAKNASHRTDVQQLLAPTPPIRIRLYNLDADPLSLFPADDADGREANHDIDKQGVSPRGLDAFLEIEGSSPSWQDEWSAYLTDINAPELQARVTPEQEVKTTDELFVGERTAQIPSETVFLDIGAGVTSALRPSLNDVSQQNQGSHSSRTAMRAPRKVAALQTVLTNNLRGLYSDLRASNLTLQRQIDHAPQFDSSELSNRNGQCVAPGVALEAGASTTEFAMGNLRWLSRELNTAGAYLITDRGLQIGPAAPAGAEIMVYGWDSGDDFDQIWLGSKWRQLVCNNTERHSHTPRAAPRPEYVPEFRECLMPMDVVALQGFQGATNAGMFQVVRIQTFFSNRSGAILWLGEILPDAPPELHPTNLLGEEAWAAAELHPPVSAVAFGCFGCLLSAAPADPGNQSNTGPLLSIKRIGPHGDFIRALRSHDQRGAQVRDKQQSGAELGLCVSSALISHQHCAFENGELVRLAGFGHAGNNGIFRVEFDPVPGVHLPIYPPSRANTPGRNQRPLAGEVCYSLREPAACRQGRIWDIRPEVAVGGRSIAQVVGNRGHFAALIRASHRDLEKWRNATVAKGPAFWPSQNRMSLDIAHFPRADESAEAQSSVLNDTGPHVVLNINGSFPLGAFEAGETVHLRNFRFRHNNGIFVVRKVEHRPWDSKAGAATTLHLVSLDAPGMAARLQSIGSSTLSNELNVPSSPVTTLCPVVPPSFEGLALPVQGIMAVSERTAEAVRCPAACLEPGAGAMRGCCAGHGRCVEASLQPLRLLPETVSALNAGLSNGKPFCFCHATFGGTFCSNSPDLPCASNCNGHGVCDHKLGKCICEFTWGALDCSERDLPCPMNCSHHGTCDRTSGKCRCHLTWGGVACEFRALPCPNDCSGHGTCDQHAGKCHCDPTWGGVDCNTVELPCLEPCCAPAVCDRATGRCECLSGSNRSGLQCCDFAPVCPCMNNPASHGICDPDTGKCLCAAGWGGLDCTVNICGHGALATGFPRCVCSPNWYCPNPTVSCGNLNDFEAWHRCSNHSAMMSYSGLGGQGQHRLFPNEDFNLGLYANQEGIFVSGRDRHARAVYDGRRPVDRYFPCSCRVFCLADGSDRDTCSKHGVGCSEDGNCLCKKYFTGKHCELPLVPTGEINQRHFEDPASRDTDLFKALFLVGTDPCPACRRRTPRSIDAVSLASVLDLCGTAPNFPTDGLESQGLAVWNQTFMIFAKAKVGYDDLEEQRCPEPYSRLYFNQFISACRQQPTLPTAILRYAFHRMDRDFSGMLSLRELVVAELVQRGYMRPAFCPRLVKPNTSTITSISDSKFREWLESLDMTALAAAPTASHPPSSNTASKSLDVAAPPTLVDVRGRWTVMHASKVVSQENSTSINLCPGDEVRIALQNFRVMNVLYSSVAEAPQVALPPNTQPKIQRKGPFQLLRVLLNDSVSAPSQADLRMWKFVPLNESLDLFSESMHDSSRGGSLKALERLTPEQKRQVRGITGTSLPPPPFMDGSLFPGPGAEKTGINIVRTVYDFVVEIWRRHDHDLDFRLTFEEFSAGSRLDPALACSMVDGCYEFIAQPDPNSIHWCKESMYAPATIQGCINDICANVNGEGSGAGKNDGDGGNGSKNNADNARRRKERARRRPQKNSLLSAYTGAGDFAPGASRSMPGSLWIPNIWAWCDMTTPFSFPFCPTPNPFFNILIKMMITGMIKPAIDQIVAALIAGQSSVTQLLTCMMPAALPGKGKEKSPNGPDSSPSNADSATRTSQSAHSSGQEEEASCSRNKQLEDGSFLEVSFLELPTYCWTPSERRQHQFLAPESSSFVETGSSEATEPDGERAGAIVNEFQKSYFVALEKSMTATLTIDLTESLTAELHELLHNRLSQELQAALEVSLSSALQHYVGSAVGATVSHSVSSLLSRLLPSALVDQLQSTLLHTMTRALTHTVGSSVTESLLYEHQLFSHHGASTLTSASDVGAADGDPAGSAGHGHGESKFSQQQADERAFHCYECEHHGGMSQVEASTSNSCLICQSLQDADGGNVRGQMPLAALRQQRKYQRFEAMYYEHFLEAYYSDYYANYYSSRQQRISTATEMAELSAIMSKSIDRN